MYNVLLDDIAKHPEQFATLHDDTNLYGGSSVANICGLGYVSPLEMWLMRTGKKTDFEVNPQMRLGSFLEPFVLELFSEQKELKTRSVNQIWQSRSRPWMIASPDAVAVDHDKLIEIKTGRFYAGKKWEDGNVADSAICQLQWYLAVSGKSGGYCVGMFGGDATDLRTQEFESNPDVQAQLIERVEAFRECVKTDMPPEAGPGDAKLIQQHLTPKIEPEKEIDLTAEHSDSAKRWVELEEKIREKKKQLKPLEQELTALKNQIVADSHGAARVLLGSEEARIQQVVREPYTSKRSSYYKISLVKPKKGD